MNRARIKDRSGGHGRKSSDFHTKGTVAPLNVSDQSKNGVGLRRTEGASGPDTYQDVKCIGAGPDTFQSIRCIGAGRRVRNLLAIWLDGGTSVRRN